MIIVYLVAEYINFVTELTSFLDTNIPANFFWVSYVKFWLCHDQKSTSVGLAHSAWGLAGMHYLYGDQLRRMQWLSSHILNVSMVCFFSVNSIHSHLQMQSEFCEDISCPSHVSVYHLMTNLSFLVQKTAPLLNVMWSHFVSFFLENNDFWERCF